MLNLGCPRRCFSKRGFRALVHNSFGRGMDRTRRRASPLQCWRLCPHAISWWVETGRRTYHENRRIGTHDLCSLQSWTNTKCYCLRCLFNYCKFEGSSKHNWRVLISELGNLCLKAEDIIIVQKEKISIEEAVKKIADVRHHIVLREVHLSVLRDYQATLEGNATTNESSMWRGPPWIGSFAHRQFQPA